MPRGVCHSAYYCSRMEGVSAYEPASRWGHTSVNIGDKVYMWGGRTDNFSESSRKDVSVRMGRVH